MSTDRTPQTDAQAPEPAHGRDIPAKSGPETAPLRLLDLFCGAGGCAVGYHRAGFEVVGVDNRPQPRYPFTFHQADALEFCREHGHEYDAIHASPPCQGYSCASADHRNNGKVYANPIPKTRELLKASEKPYVIENVERAPLSGIKLCGVMFGLGVFRHRIFESSIFMLNPYHLPHDGTIGDGKYFSVAGGGGRWKTWGTVHRNISKGTADQWRNAMGIGWMTRNEVKDAIPPAYTEWIGHRLMEALCRRP